MILPMPFGWDLIEEHGDGGKFIRKRDHLMVIVDSGCEQMGDDRLWYHLSVSTPTKVPTYDQLKEVKEVFLGDRYACMVFPPKRFFVNQHPYVLHLWSTNDEQWPLPEFGKYGTL